MLHFDEFWIISKQENLKFENLMWLKLFCPEIGSDLFVLRFGLENRDQIWRDLFSLKKSWSYVRIKVDHRDCPYFFGPTDRTNPSLPFIYPWLTRVRSFPKSGSLSASLASSSSCSAFYLSFSCSVLRFDSVSKLDTLSLDHSDWTALLIVSHGLMFGKWFFFIPINVRYVLVWLLFHLMFRKYIW